MSLSVTNITTNSVTVPNFYGGDVDSISRDGFIWSTDLRITLRGPAATTAGIATYGRIKVGSLDGTTYTAE